MSWSGWPARSTNRLGSRGSRIGIDATHKLPEEDARTWPEEIVMSEEIRELVSRRWADYGIA